ncbi:MAG: TrkA family potassium uptake protein [Methanomicrobiales archaeon]|nr:TrkA family potassium uptake protein [Methanomicrobiales archaeon]
MGISVLIAGGGKVGTHLAQILISSGHHVVILENGKEDYERLKLEFPSSVLVKGDPSNPHDLSKAGIKTVGVVAAVTRDDEMNLVIASLARFEFRVKRTIARVNTPKHAWLFTREMGVDVLINQADFMAHLIAREMSVGDMLTMFKLQTGEYSLVENVVRTGSKAAGKVIKDIQFPQECIISAIIREGKLVIPRGSVMLVPGDEVLAVMHVSSVESVKEILQGS